MNTWALAKRNLLRNRRRSLATLLALSIGAVAVLLFGGFSADIRTGLLTSYVQNGGHLRIQHRDFFLFGNGNPTAYGIPGYQKLVAAIRTDPELTEGITVVTPALVFGGLAANFDAGVSRTVVGVGYMAADITRMRDWNEFRMLPLLRPNPLQGAPEDAAVVGIGLARVLLLCGPLGVADCPRPTAEPTSAGKSQALPADVAALALGEAPSSDTVTRSSGQGVPLELLATQPRGAPNVTRLNVVAAEDQGFKELDEITVLLHLEHAQRLVYGRGEPRATSIMVQLRNTAAIPAARERIAHLLDREMPDHSLTVLDFRELNPFFGETINLFNTIFSFIFLLIGAIVVFTVSNTMTAAVVERTTEIGTLRAVGLRQDGVRRLFVAEGFVLGCAGAIAGAFVAILLAYAINNMSLTWLPPGTSTPLPLTVRVGSELRMILSVTVGLIVIATVSAWLPAWRAARTNIVDALRHA